MWSLVRLVGVCWARECRPSCDASGIVSAKHQDESRYIAETLWGSGWSRMCDSRDDQAESKGPEPVLRVEGLTS